ncbi:MAG: hypothetical protein K0U98_13895 [Deltaproteobacteria bacterium]|nr:hypothetical protein [Deltaproteobacteria bacterium]
MIRQPLTVLTLFGFALSLTLVTVPARAQLTKLYECSIDLLTMKEIVSCDLPVAETSSEIWSNLQPQPDLFNQMDTRCRFQFWSFDGRYVAGTETEQIHIPAGQTKEAVAWYICSGDCEGGNCPPITHVIGLDLTRNARTHDPVVASVDPAFAADGCTGLGATNPCSTLPGETLSSITAKSTVDGLSFLTWARHSPGDREAVSPSSVEVALYSNSEQPNYCESLKIRLGLEGICMPPFEPVFPDYRAELPMLWVQWGIVLPDICPIDGCPQCAGTCPGSVFTFSNAELFDITVYDLRSRRAVAWAEPLGDGVKQVRFVPQLDDSEIFQQAYAFVFSSIGGSSRGKRLDVGVSFATRGEQ